MTAAMGSAGGIAAVAERFLSEVVSRGELDAVDEIFAADHMIHHPPMPDLPSGPDGMRELVARQRRGFPDAVFRLDELLVAGDRVVARGVIGGTSAQEIQGMAATGRHALVPAMYWFRFDGLRIAETWIVLDRLAGALQAGMVVLSEEPTPDPGWV